MFEGIYRRLFEKRSSSYAYTDAVVDAILASSTDAEASDVRRTHAAEAGIGIISRAFALADVEPAIAALTPAMLSHISRQMIGRGEAVLYLSTYDSWVIPSSYDVSGSYEPSSWRYQLALAGPAGQAEVHASADRVLHFRYAVESERPWVGVSPLQGASTSARAALRLEASLEAEAKMSTGLLIPIPPQAGRRGTDGSAPGWLSQIKNLKGQIAYPPSLTSGLGDGRIAAPARDWVPQRIGPMPPAEVVELRQSMLLSSLAALGVPAELVGGASDAGLREAYRRFTFGTLLPMGELIAAELGQKLNRTYQLGFDRLHAADIASRARALGSLVQSGVGLDEAMELAGF